MTLRPCGPASQGDAAVLRLQASWPPRRSRAWSPELRQLSETAAGAAPGSGCSGCQAARTRHPCQAWAGRAQHEAGTRPLQQNGAGGGPQAPRCPPLLWAGAQSQRGGLLGPGGDPGISQCAPCILGDPGCRSARLRPQGSRSPAPSLPTLVLFFYWWIVDLQQPL